MVTGSEPLWFLFMGPSKGEGVQPTDKNIGWFEREFKKIPKFFLNSTFLNFKTRCELIIYAEGGHIE
jgi:hypothetical protein